MIMYLLDENLDPSLRRALKRASMPVHLANHLNAGRHMPGILVIKRNMP